MVDGKAQIDLRNAYVCPDKRVLDSAVLPNNEVQNQMTSSKMVCLVLVFIVRRLKDNDTYCRKNACCRPEHVWNTSHFSFKTNASPQYMRQLKMLIGETKVWKRQLCVFHMSNSQEIQMPDCNGITKRLINLAALRLHWLDVILKWCVLWFGQCRKRDSRLNKVQELEIVK